MLSPLEASPNKYRSREASSLVADWNPPPASLYAWFKVNEGSGQTIIDYGPLATNGRLHVPGFSPPIPTSNMNYFWNHFSGFGTSEADMGAGGNQIGAAVYRGEPNFNTAYLSAVVFFRPMGTGFYGSHQAIQLGESAGVNLLLVGWESVTSPHYLSFGPAYYNTAYELTYSTWYCVYVYSRGGANDNGLYVRKSGDGNWTLAGQNMGTMPAAGTQALILLGNQALNYCTTMTIADSLFYAGATSTGIISLAQATDIFNNLKSRYGMT